MHIDVVRLRQLGRRQLGPHSGVVLAGPPLQYFCVGRGSQRQILQRRGYGFLQLREPRPGQRRNGHDWGSLKQRPRALCCHVLEAGLLKPLRWASAHRARSLPSAGSARWITSSYRAMASLVEPACLNAAASWRLARDAMGSAGSILRNASAALWGASCARWISPAVSNR